MKIKYNPAIDLCSAMFQYIHWNEIASGIPGYRYSTELQKWHDEVIKQTSGLLANDLQYLLHDFLGLTFLPLEFAIRENITSAPGLIERLRKEPSEALPERLFQTYSTDVDFNSIKNNPEKIIDTINRAGGTVRKKEPELFLDFTQYPGSFQKRLCDVMDDFYRTAVEPYEKQIRTMIDRQIRDEQKILDEDPARFFSGFCRVSPDDSEVLSEIFISFFNEIDIIQLDEPASLIYGRCRNRIENHSLIPLEQIYSLLADESRRTIMQLLCRKSWFTRELAEEMGLTSATVSYHLSKLSALDLVSYERGERKRVYYSANRTKVKEMLNSVQTDILG